MWLGHVSAYPTEPLPRHKLFGWPDNFWKMTRNGQSTTWEKITKTLSSGRPGVNANRLPGWGPGDHPKPWLEIIGDMVYCRCRWHSQILNLSSVWFFDLMCFCQSSPFIALFCFSIKHREAKVKTRAHWLKFIGCTNCENELSRLMPQVLSWSQHCVSLHGLSYFH